MEKRGLTGYLLEEAILRLTGEAFQPLPEKEKKGNAPRLLALAACLALVVAAANLDTVYAAVRELLYFLPGSGPVGEADAALDYWLPTGEYAAGTVEGDYFVAYLYRRGDTLSLRVEKRVEGLPEENGSRWEVPLPPEGNGSSGEAVPISRPEEDWPETVPLPYSRPAEVTPAAPERRTGGIAVSFRDEDGKALELSTEERSVSAVLDETTGEAWYEEELQLPNFTWEKFTLVLDGTVEFPVELSQVDPKGYALTGSAAVSDAGYSVSLLPLNKNCTRFALLPAPEGERKKTVPAGSYWEALAYELAAVGESGKAYEVQPVNHRPGCQEFYLPALPEEKIVSVTVTGILESTRYERPPAAVLIPPLSLGEEAVLEQRLELGNITLIARSAGLTGEGELWVDLTWEQEEGRRLNQVDFTWPENPQGVHTTLRSSVTPEGCRLAKSGMESVAGKKVKLPVEFLSLVQEGEWALTS